MGNDDWKTMFHDAELKWEFLSKKKRKKKHKYSATDHSDIVRKHLPELDIYAFSCSFCDRFHSYKKHVEFANETACKGCPLNDSGNNCQDRYSLLDKYNKKYKRKHAKKLLELIRSLRPQYVK